MILKKFLKILSCFVVIAVVLVLSVVPSFAYVANNSTSLVAPWSAVFSYRNVNNSLVYRSYSVDVVDNSSGISSSSIDIMTGNWTTYVNVKKHYSTTGNKVYGYTDFEQLPKRDLEYDPNDPYTERLLFNGLDFYQPLLIQRPFTAGDFGSLSITYDEAYHSQFERDYGFLFTYSLYNFETGTFDSYTDFLIEDDYDGRIDLNFVNDIYGHATTAHVYDKLMIIGSMSYKLVDYDLSNDTYVPYGIDWDTLQIAPGKTYPNLGGNRNDEYLSHILSKITEDHTIVNPVYIDEDTDFLSWISNSVGSFLNYPLFGSDVFTLGNLFIVVIAIGLVIVFLRIFAGG